MSRILDDISEAEVIVPVDGDPDSDCCRILRSLRAWQHELALYRDGVLVWVGPVTEPLEFTADTAKIGARDLFAWLERRILPFDRFFSNEDLIVIFVLYFQDAIGLDPSPNITIASHHTNVFAFREVRASEFRRAADELRELGRSGLDWTMQGRILRAGGREIPLHTQVTLTSETLLGPTLEIRGLDTSTETIVVGAPGTDAGDPFVGRAGGIHPDLGLLQSVHQEPSIIDQPSADHAAQTRLDMLRESPIYLSGRLSPELQVDFDQLVAGLRINMRMEVACHQIIGQLRLLELDVQVTASDEGVNESIDVTLVPLGTT